MKNRKKGFTLVELAIVLVIIGILIGGILAAQSIISTSKVEAVTMELGQFDAEVENFKTKYNYLPGDAPAFGGDGNGVISITIGAGSCCGITYPATFNLLVKLLIFLTILTLNNFLAPYPVLVAVKLHSQVLKRWHQDLIKTFLYLNLVDQIHL